MADVLIEHSATVYHADGTNLTVKPHQDSEDGLIELVYKDGEDAITMVMFPDMALALSSVITRIVSLNAKAK